jgi:predicted PurR-regulated permease PerM
VLAVVILFAIQQIDANFIYPKVVGSSTGLHPLAVLLSVSVFGYFGGILGMILAVPLAGIIQIFVLRWFEERERRISENIQDDAEQQAK